jgi:ParB family chromosome partitioning protein
MAFAAVLHKFVLATFYRFASSSSCLEITVRAPTLPPQAPRLNDSASAKAIETRHGAWRMRLPKTEGDLWNTLITFDAAEQLALFAHCASSGVNALYEPANRTHEGRVCAHGVRRRLDHADVLARAVGLDMVAAGWTTSVDNYLGRVTKPRILEAVREAKGYSSAQLIDHLKKGDMAREAERLLEGTGWLLEPLRLTDAEAVGDTDEAQALPEFLADDDEVDAETDEDQPYVAAAE